MTAKLMSHKAKKKRQPHVKKSAKHPPGIEPTPLAVRTKRMYHWVTPLKRTPQPISDSIGNL